MAGSDQARSRTSAGARVTTPSSACSEIGPCLLGIYSVQAVATGCGRDDLFIKGLDETQTRAERKANRTGRPLEDVIIPTSTFTPEGKSTGLPYADLRDVIGPPARLRTYGSERVELLDCAPARTRLMNLDHLGTPLQPMIQLNGKSSNRVYRLDTSEGSFAVKALMSDRDWASRHDDVFRLEQAAFSAGVPMPEPISADAEVIVHRWVEADAVPEEPVPPAFAFETGEILARIHALDITWTDRAVEGRTPQDWPELAERAVDTRQPWADELASTVDVLLAISDFIDNCERPGPIVLTHRDIHPWNLLARHGRPIVLDWEIAGMLDLAGELGSTALSLAKGPGFDDIDPAVFRSVLDGYVAGGGALPPPGPSWFVFMIGGWLGFTRRNILQCLTGIGAQNGPDLATCHDEVGNGLRGLPDMFGRLPQLEDLLVRR